MHHIKNLLLQYISKNLSKKDQEAIYMNWIDSLDKFKLKCEGCFKVMNDDLDNAYSIDGDCYCWSCTKEIAENDVPTYGEEIERRNL